MSAKDYKICPAWQNIYIAKVSKRNSNLMLNDRKPISEGEILGIIEWYARNYCIEHKTSEIGITKNGSEIYTIKISGELLEEVKNEIKMADNEKENKN